MVQIPETKYAKTVDGVNIAYRVQGDGPVDLVYIIGMAGNFEIEFEARGECGSSSVYPPSPG